MKPRPYIKAYINYYTFIKFESCGIKNGGRNVKTFQTTN